MPLYEFVCRQCNKDFETIVPSDRRDNVACPECGNPRTARKISLVSPAQVKSTFAPPCQSAGCEYQSCCGGACGLPN